MSLLRSLISLSQKATSSSSDRTRTCSKRQISASSSLSRSYSSSNRRSSSSRCCSWSSLSEDRLSRERECSLAAAVVRKENLLFWATLTLCRLLTQTPQRGSWSPGQQQSICYYSIITTEHITPSTADTPSPLLVRQGMEGLQYLMEEALASIDNYPLEEILRQDDHSLRLSSYFSVHASSFPFDSYDYGSKKLKQQYGITPKLYRYFNKRHFLFSRFDQGIRIDEESWYSVIPEPVAHHLLARLKIAKIKRVFQPFCGVGGIAVHLAGHFQQYVVNDIDPEKLEMLTHNLQIYQKSAPSLTIINQDFLEVQPFPTDAVIICPPWGGIDTSQYASLPLDDIMQPQLTPILLHAVKFSHNLVLQLPKQTSLRNLISVVHRTGLEAIFTVEKIETNQRCSQLFFYFGRKAFTGMDAVKLEAVLLRDIDNAGKVEKKRVKAALKDQCNSGILVDVYKARFPNKRILLL